MLLSTANLQIFLQISKNICNIPTLIHQAMTACSDDDDMAPGNPKMDVKTLDFTAGKDNAKISFTKK